MENTAGAGVSGFIKIKLDVLLLRHVVVGRAVRLLLDDRPVPQEIQIPSAGIRASELSLPQRAGQVAHVGPPHPALPRATSLP
jgi:hypothetical protein